MAFHPNGETCAAGTMGGVVQIFTHSIQGGKHDSLVRVAELKRPKGRDEWISDPGPPRIRTTPSAVATSPSAVTITTPRYDCRNRYELVGVQGPLVLHHAHGLVQGWLDAVHQLGDYEILYWHMPKGVQIVRSSECKDVPGTDGPASPVPGHRRVA